MSKMTEEEKKVFDDNKGLVFYFLKHVNYPKGLYEDSKQVCFIGLMKAAQTYKEGKNIKFSSYAMKVIQNEYFMLLRDMKKRSSELLIIDGSSNNDSSKESFLSRTMGLDSKNIDDFEGNCMVKEYIEAAKNTINSYEDREKKIVEEYLKCVLSDKKISQKCIGDITKASQSYVSRVIQKFRDDFAEEIKDIAV
jgi:RNA polymerase sigma factor (sigma-70 family)